MFGIAVPGILKELSGTITSFPAERVVEDEEVDVVFGLDELAARRKRKTS